MQEGERRGVSPTCPAPARGWHVGLTGARRSELIRLRVSDLDLEAGYARISEKKRKQGALSSRRVPLPSPLIDILKQWLEERPRGPSLFCQPARVTFSRTKRTAPTPLTPGETHDHRNERWRGASGM